jgi:hypothetical protein
VELRFLIGRQIEAITLLGRQDAARLLDLSMSQLGRQAARGDIPIAAFSLAESRFLRLTD